MIFEYLKSTVKAIAKICAVIGGALSILIGPFSGLLYCLIAFMIIDYLSGVISAIANKNLSSSVGFKGIAKKVMILALIIIGNLLDNYVIGTGDVARTMIISFYLANEGISITENCAELGLPIPEKLLNILKNFNCSNDEEKESKEDGEK